MNAAGTPAAVDAELPGPAKRPRRTGRRAFAGWTQTVGTTLPATMVLTPGTSTPMALNGGGGVPPTWSKW